MVPDWLIYFASCFGAVVLGIAVLVAVRAIEDRHSFPYDDPLHIGLSVFGWVSLLVGFVGAFTCIGGPLGFLVGIVGLFVLDEILLSRRRAQHGALLWVIAAAAERFIPLVTAVEAFAQEEGGAFGHRARRLARLLAEGVSLPVAMKESRTLFPMESISLLHVGQESGALAVALRQVASQRDAYRQVLASLAGKLAYFCMVIFFAIGVVTFVMLKIVPAFQKIFYDFDAELPAMTRALIDVSSFMGVYGFLFTPIFLAAALVLIYIFVRNIGWTHWDPPGVDRLIRRLDTAVILDALALAAKRQHPLHTTIAVLARSYHKTSIRGLLHNVVCDINAGVDWCESLLKRGLIRRVDAAVLKAAQAAGNLPWALGEMADSNRRRVVYRLHALVQVLFPPVVLAMGAFVMFFVVSMFLPLIKLIQSLV